MSKVKDTINSAKASQPRGREHERNMRKKSFGVTSRNVSADGLIMTDAKVGDINSYVTYAATSSVPYLLSTKSRHEDLVSKGNREHIVKRVRGEMDLENQKILELMSKQLREEEDIKFKKSGIGTDSGIGDSVDSFIDFLNNFYGDAKSTENYITKTTGSAREAFYAFIDEYTTSDAFFEEVKRMFTEVVTADSFKSGDYSKTLNSKGKVTNYRMQETGHIQDIQQALADILDTINRSPDLHGNDLKTISISLTHAAVVLGRSKAQGDKKGIDDYTFNRLASMIKSAVDKAGGADSAIKFTKNIYGHGHINEILTNDFLQTALNNIHAKISIGNPDEVIEEIVVQVLSGSNDAINKTFDAYFEYNDVKFGVDTKSISEKKVNESNLIYQSSVQVNFNEGINSIIKDGEGISPNTKKLYSSLILNRIAVGQKYQLSREEREMLFLNHFSKKDNFDSKFQVDSSSEVEGFPTFSTVNGRFMRFSDVILNMSIGGLDHDGKNVNVSEGSKISKETALEVYEDKVKTSKKLNGGLVRKMKGFSANVESHKSVVKQITSEYNKGQKTKVRFSIAKK